MLKAQLEDSMDVRIATVFIAISFNISQHVLVNRQLSWSVAGDEVIACFLRMLVLRTVGWVSWGGLVLLDGGWEPFVDEFNHKGLYV